MWKESLVARFHNRSGSLKAQGAPLISSRGPRPFSTATLDTVHESGSRPFSTVTLDPVLEQEGNDEQPRDIPSPSDRPTTIPVTAPASSNEKAAQLFVPITPENNPPPSKDNRDIESNDPSRMRSIKSFLMEELDTSQASAPLTAYCFMTGFMYVSSKFLLILLFAHPPTQRRSELFCDIRLVCFPDRQLCTSTSVDGISRLTR